MLELEHIQKAFDGVPVLKDLSLQVEDGEIVSILGPSGCGKTTLLNIILGIVDADQGEIRYSGEDLTRTPMEKRGFNIVFQDYALFPNLNVQQNITYGLRNKPGISSREEVDELIDLLGLREHLGKRIDQLSGGQKQRVALARAVVIEPSVLLFDEPLSNLDAKLRESMRDELRALQKRLGITSLYVTHDQSEAMAISDRVVIMKDGVICQQGTPTEIYEQPNSRFVANFIGKANFIDGTFRGMDGENALVEVGGHTFPIPAPGKMEGVQKDGPCCLAVRPESILLSEEEGPLSGRVSRATYYGAKVEYEVMLGDQPIIVEVYNPQLSKRFAEGEAVHMTLIDRCVRVLA